MGTQRHVQTRFLWYQERVAAKQLVIKAVGTKANVADMLTKAMHSVAEFEGFITKLGLEARSGSSRLQRAALSQG